ncbi:MAG: DUF2442 domain-containing protein [Rhodocyclaceae bacterium]|nr:DUF2442 domain-containing protein [Rhodocyclaceae bacterium]
MPVISHWSKAMILHITTAEYLHDYKLAVTFDNGCSGIADLTEVLDSGIFKALRDTNLFSQVTVDDQMKTVVWPNGLDLAPEYVYFQAFKDDLRLLPQFEAWGYAEQVARDGLN